MIEVLFGDSEGGAMKIAKNYQKPDLKNSGISWIGEKPNKKELKKIFDKMSDGKAVGGNSQEVVCLSFLLDIGDGWYAKRMNRMIEQGELVVVEKHEEVYRQVLKKA